MGDFAANAACVRGIEIAFGSSSLTTPRPHPENMTARASRICRKWALLASAGSLTRKPHLPHRFPGGKGGLPRRPRYLIVAYGETP